MEKSEVSSKAQGVRAGIDTCMMYRHLQVSLTTQTGGAQRLQPEIERRHARGTKLLVPLDLKGLACKSGPAPAL